MSLSPPRVGPDLGPIHKQNIAGNQFQLDTHPHALLENFL